MRIRTPSCERSELSNPGSIFMRCVRTYVCTYVSVTLRNVMVTSRRNVASMMQIRTPSTCNNTTQVSAIVLLPLTMQCTHN